MTNDEKKQIEKSRAEVETLKAEWLKDDTSPKIEDTEGFEAYRDELKIFRLEQEILEYEKTVEGLSATLTKFHNCIEISRLIFAPPQGTQEDNMQALVRAQQAAMRRFGGR